MATQSDSRHTACSQANLKWREFLHNLEERLLTNYPGSVTAKNKYHWCAKNNAEAKFVKKCNIVAEEV